MLARDADNRIEVTLLTLNDIQESLDDLQRRASLLRQHGELQADGAVANALESRRSAIERGILADARALVADTSSMLAGDLLSSDEMAAKKLKKATRVFAEGADAETLIRKIEDYFAVLRWWESTKGRRPERDDGDAAG